MVSLALTAAFLCGCTRPNAGPRQPLAFSHRIHAGQNQIACQYCHAGVRSSTAAGIPSLQRCIGCHTLVAATKPEIVRLRAFYDTKSQVRWIRLNDIPDFVHFNHRPHVARGFACQKCHGMVQTMDELQPPFRLASMSWCVECHRENGGSVDCYTCHR